MKTYIYPANLKVKATFKLWSLRDLLILGIITVLSLWILIYFKASLPLACSIAYGVATARFDGQCIADYIRIAARYFISVPQTYLWRKP